MERNPAITLVLSTASNLSDAQLRDAFFYLVGFMESATEGKKKVDADKLTQGVASALIHGAKRKA